MRTVFPALPGLIRETLRGWSQDRAHRTGAALAYYTLLSIAPLLVIALAVLSLAWGPEVAEGRVADLIVDAIGRDGMDAFGVIVETRQAATGVLGTFAGVALLFFGASRAYDELRDAMNTIWGVQRPVGTLAQRVAAKLEQRLTAVLIAIGGLLLLLTSLALSAVLAAVGRTLTESLPGGEALWHIVNFGLTWGFVTVALSAVFKWVPSVDLEWGDVVLGAAFSAFLFALAKLLAGLYLGKLAGGSVRGVAGAMVIFTLWVHFSALLLVFGVHLSYVYTHRFGSRSGATPDQVANF